MKVAHILLWCAAAVVIIVTCIPLFYKNITGMVFVQEGLQDNDDLKMKVFVIPNGLKIDSCIYSGKGIPLIFSTIKASIA